jgi:hypothetical protein
MLPECMVHGTNRKTLHVGIEEIAGGVLIEKNSKDLGVFIPSLLH